MKEQTFIKNENNKTLSILINGKIFKFKKGDQVVCEAGKGTIIILND